MGALYMLWIGSRLALSARRGDLDALATAEHDAQPQSAGRSWARGFTTNLLNPKIGAFYVAILPQFIPAHASHLAVGLLLALVHDLEGLIGFSALILGAHTVRELLERRQVRRSIDGITGATLLGFGIKLGLSSR